MDFRNAVTQYLEDAEPYHRSDHLMIYTSPIKGGGVAVAYFPDEYGRMTFEGLKEFYSQIQRIAKDNRIKGVILTDNNETRKEETGERHVSIPGINIITN